MLKRLLSVTLSVLIVLSALTLSVTAANSETGNTFSYVALGDSIAAGYGLVDAGALNKDPSLLITEERIENPVEAAYPAVFGSYLKELGQQYGYTVSATNLSAPAIRAEDLPHILQEPGYIPEIAANLFETYHVEGAREAFSNYHDIFVKYLTDADLISVQLGINDISEGVFTPMTGSENSVIKAIGTATVRTFNGSDTTTAINTAKQILDENKDKIDAQAIREAAAYLTNVFTHPEIQIENSAAQVKNAVAAIKELNPNAKIALVSQYNVLGNSLEYGGQTYSAYAVVKNIFTKSASFLSGDQTEDASIKDILAQLGTLISDETAYPLQYMLFGKNIDSSILALNKDLEEIAQENDLIYVDIYDKVSNKKGLNPHPDAKGHQEIAAALKAQLTDLVIEMMTGEAPESDSYIIKRISNPDGKEREVDGLIGDRGTSYTWRMAKRGDDIYIATYRNLLNGVISIFQRTLAPQGVSSDLVWALTNTITNGEIPASEDSDGAYIIKFNTTTGEFSKVFTFPSLMQCRMVVNYDGDIYCGSYSSVLPRQNLYKIDENDEVSIVFSTSESFSIRANCVYDAGEGDHLYFAGADEREALDEGDEGCCRIAVWEKDADDDTVWNRVADYKDFYDYAADPGMKNSSGCPVWELANHNGYIYAGMPYSKGFIIFRGRPAEDGESANEYGWIWEEVVGAKNGVNHPGMAADPAGHADSNFSAIVSVYEFNGELYCFDFDQTIVAELAFIQGALYKATGQNVSLSDMVKPVYDTLHHTQTLWKLNDETGEFEVCEGFTELMKGTTNEYVWRAQEHNGYLYVSTMDSAVIYNYITRLSNGSITTMSEEEIEEQLAYIQNLIDLISPIAKDKISQRLSVALEELKAMLEELESFELSEEQAAEFNERFRSLNEKIEKLLKNFGNAIAAKLSGYLEKIAEGEIEEKDVDAELAMVAASVDNENALDKVRDQLDKASIALDLLNAFLEGYTLDPEQGDKNLKMILELAANNFLDKISDMVKEINDSIDWEGIEMYRWVSDTVANDTWGFDLVRTKDGVNFEVVTDNGFGDKYNYGCPSFLSTDDGLYIGTCNPFYGAQLYLLTTEESEDDPTEPDDTDDPWPVELGRWYVLGDADGDGEVGIFDVTTIQRYLADIINEDYIDLVASDVSRDTLDIFDAADIQRYLASMNVSYPIGERFNRATGKGVEAINETILLDKEDVKVTAKSFGRGYLPYLTISVENNSQKDADIGFKSIAVNGYETSADFSFETEDGGSYEASVTVPAGTTSDFILEFNNMQIEDSNFEFFAEIVLITVIRNPETYQAVATQKSVIKTSEYGSFEYSFDESGTLIYDKNGIKIVMQGAKDDDVNTQYVYISNQSDKDIAVHAETCKINGKEIGCIAGSNAYSGNRAIGIIGFFDDVKQGDELDIIFTISELDANAEYDKTLDTTDAFRMTL